MISRRTILALPFLASGACKAALVESPAEVFARSRISFSRPQGWSQEDSEDKAAIYFMSPEIEGGVDASLAIELPQSVNEQSLEADLKSHSERLAAKYVRYKERRLLQARTDRGLRYGLIEYEATKNQIAVIEQVIYVPMPKGMRIFIFGSTTQRTASVNLPVFDKFMRSLVATQWRPASRHSQVRPR